ncbi:type II toxin-antitoxin system HicB family antitoxin [Longimicrobium sp.]|uniref:type II toxin-antitoxin system HicB family antitoxin n=1 Tax=Longimicrobium sp. TaxID=2029185 RepID=UPI002E331E74|nr:type II toxin-antitoxin system HicB family antitoxin [Longimicrobium sp.]HEX6042625.1 type II toxin-antitoxin system HicB family antitoxin [Longimicrobium sp.]
MQRTLRLTAVITRDGGEYVSLCPALDIASQGSTIEDARENLIEAVALFYECADETEITRRESRDVHVTEIDVTVLDTVRLR